MFCASSGRAGSGVRIRYLTRVRTGHPFGWVSRMLHISENQPTSDAETSCLRNWFSRSTSISASRVTPGFSVTGPLTNAVNTDMKGCPIWCPFCPLAASLYAFPCALAAANGWNEATSPSTSHVRQRNPLSRRWIGRTVAGARLDDRSEVRCVRDDVPVSLLIDFPVFTRSQSLHLQYLESPLPSSDRQMRSQASARFWLSMTLFGLQRFHPCVFLPYMFLHSARIANRIMSRHGSIVGATKLCNFCKPRSRDTR